MTVTPCSPASVSALVLEPIASWRFLAIWLIWSSVTWKGLLSSHFLPSLTPSWRLLDRLSTLAITCQTTTQPTTPMTTKPPMNTMAVARPRGTPIRLRRATNGCSSAVINRAAAKASTTRLTAPITRISTQTVPASTSSRQLISAATRMLHGTAPTGSMAGRMVRCAGTDTGRGAEAAVTDPAADGADSRTATGCSGGGAAAESSTGNEGEAEGTGSASGWLAASRAEWVRL